MGGKRKDSFASESDWFWAKVEKSAACWRWTGAIGGTGYGSLNFRGKWSKAHRISWELSKGSIPPRTGPHGVVVAHKCDNRWCVNPEHLFLCSQQENIKDMITKGRNSRGERHATHLSEEDVLRIREAALFGASKDDLATCYGVSPALISAITLGNRWSHVGGARTKRIGGRQEVSWA